MAARMSSLWIMLRPAVVTPPMYGVPFFVPHQVIVIGSGAVEQDDERVAGGAVGLDEVGDVGIDPAGAVDAAGGVAGAAGPGARLAPIEAGAFGVQVGRGDGGDAVAVADGGESGLRQDRPEALRVGLDGAALLAGATAVAERLSHRAAGQRRADAAVAVLHAIDGRGTGAAQRGVRGVGQRYGEYLVGGFIDGVVVEDLDGHTELSVARIEGEGAAVGGIV